MDASIYSASKETFGVLRRELDAQKRFPFDRSLAPVDSEDLTRLAKVNGSSAKQDAATTS
jgi:hypothetical protein